VRKTRRKIEEDSCEVTLLYDKEDEAAIEDAIVEWLSRLLDDPSFDESPPP
jgi:hypothetical protein